MEFKDKLIRELGNKFTHKVSKNNSHLFQFANEADLFHVNRQDLKRKYPNIKDIKTKNNYLYFKEGVLDANFELKKGKAQPDANSISVNNTTDTIVNQKKNQMDNPYYYGSGLGNIFEDFLRDDFEKTETEFINSEKINDNVINDAIETIIYTVNNKDKKNKITYYILLELIENLNIEELSLTIKRELCKKLLNKDNKIIETNGE